MRLLALPFSRPEFFELQQAIDAVEETLGIVETQKVGVSKANISLTMVGPCPTELSSAKYIEWSRRRKQGQIAIRFHSHSLEETLNALDELNHGLAAKVELARELLIEAVWEQEAVRNASLNISMADDLCSSTQTFIARERSELSKRDGEPFSWTVEFLKEHVLANVKHFTARFRPKEGSWSYYQKQPKPEWGEVVPAVPCLTHDQAIATAREFVKGRSNPSSLEVEIYDIRRSIGLCPEALLLSEQVGIRWAFLSEKNGTLTAEQKRSLAESGIEFAKLEGHPHDVVLVLQIEKVLSVLGAVVNEETGVGYRGFPLRLIWIAKTK